MKRRMAVLMAIMVSAAVLTACGAAEKKEASETVSSASSEAASSAESEAASEAVSSASSEAASSAESETASSASAASSAAETEEETKSEEEPEEEAAEAVPEEDLETADEEAEADSAGEEAEADSAGEESEASSDVTASAADAMVENAMHDPIMDFPTLDGDYAVEDCVKLGDYKNLKLDMEINEVTEEDIDNYLSYLVQPVEVEDEETVLEEGDTANLDFTGYLDGEEFSGGAGTDYDLEIGSGTFIPGFEDQMIGMKKGEERDLNVTFPDNYASEELAGQDVVFHVKLNAVKRMPEMNDDWAAEYSNGEYKTLEEFRGSTRADLEEQNRSYAENNLRNKAWNAVVENSEMIAFPEIRLQEKRDEYNSYMESEAQMYGLTAEEYIEQMGMTQEQFDQINEVQVRTEVKNELLLDAVVEAEGITEEDPDYQAELKKLTEDYGMSVDELKKTYGEDVLTRHLNSLVAIEKILSYADITEKTVTAE